MVDILKKAKEFKQETKHFLKESLKVLKSPQGVKKLTICELVDEKHSSLTYLL